MGDVGPRHALYDERKRKLILKAVKRGIPRRRAAAAIGIAAGTLDRWMRDGALAERRQEEGLELTEYEERCRAFRALVHRAEQQWAAGAILAAQEFAISERKPAVVLEILRRHPVTREEWNVPQKIEATPLQSEERPELSDEDLAAAVTRLHRISQERLQNEADGNGTSASDAGDAEGSASGNSGPRRRRQSVKEK
jgi:hypothetical protein